MQLDAATKRCVAGLHKGAGVWRPELREQLTRTSLGTLWGVAADASDLVLVCTVIYRLEELIRTRSAREQLILPGLYNFAADHELRKLKLGDRQSVIAQGNPGQSFSERSQTRILVSFQDAILAALQAGLAPVDEAALLGIVRREQRFADEAAGFIGPSTFSELVRKVYAAPLNEATKAFLRVRVSFGVSTSGQPIIASSPTEGAWLCVFTKPHGLSAHRSATRDRQPPSGGVRTMSGADVVELVHGLEHPTGILVDPPCGADLDMTCAMAIGPETVAELVSR
jgi:hypothetical protein